MTKQVLLSFALFGAIFHAKSQTCGSPLQLSCDQVISGTTLGETNDFEIYGVNCSGSAGAKEGNDVVYQITPNGTGELTANLSNFSGSMRIAAFTSCQDDSSSCIEVSNGFPFPTDEEIKFDVVSGTTYYIVVDGTNADDSSTFDLDILCPQTTSVVKTLADEISIYPNPTNGDIFIKGINLRNTSFDIVDVSGKTINNEINTNQTNIDLSTLNKGVYFIRFNRGEETAVKKITIN